MKKFTKSIHQKPNKSELLVDSMINSLSNDYKLNILPNLTIINGKIPDWINCNGQKRCINFNGVYWHLTKLLKENSNLKKEQVEFEEKKSYEELGFKLLIIWEDELKNREQLLNKINDFIGVKNGL